MTSKPSPKPRGARKKRRGRWVIDRNSDEFGEEATMRWVWFKPRKRTARSLPSKRAGRR